MRDGAIVCIDISPGRINGGMRARDVERNEKGGQQILSMIVLIVCPFTPLHDGNHLGSIEGI